MWLPWFFVRTRLLLVLTKTQSCFIGISNYEALQRDFRSLFSETHPKPGSASRELHGSSFKQEHLCGLSKTQSWRLADTHSKSKHTVVLSRAKLLPKCLSNTSNESSHSERNELSMKGLKEPWKLRGKVKQLFIKHLLYYSAEFSSVEDIAQSY